MDGAWERKRALACIVFLLGGCAREELAATDDCDALGPGDAVILCGVSIPHTKKLVGHSDADVGLHALTDALLGAIADGDIGVHFPPSDDRWRGASGRVNSPSPWTLKTVLWKFAEFKTLRMNYPENGPARLAPAPTSAFSQLRLRKGLPQLAN